MPKSLFAFAAVVGVGLAVLVTVSGFRTSTARFTASTDNRSNLWEAANITLTVSEDRAGAADLFLDGSGLYPGRTVKNCVLVDVDSSTETTLVTLHGEIQLDDGLAEHFDIRIERGTPQGGCERFTVEGVIFEGSLLDMATAHGSFQRGITMADLSVGSTPLRFTGVVRDTNEAQGRATEYLVHLEARP